VQAEGFAVSLGFQIRNYKFEILDDKLVLSVD
jgi:hypothetical protein